MLAVGGARAEALLERAKKGIVGRQRMRLEHQRPSVEGLRHALDGLAVAKEGATLISVLS